MKLNELLENSNLGLTIFDIDDTLFRTTAQIKVVKDGKVVRSLNNQEFNTYQLKPGESFDFGEFKDAEKFNKESIPIRPMIAKLKAIIDNSRDSKVIMLTARSDFDNKELFLDTFKQHGIDMSRVHVHRAGNLGGSPSQNKAVWIRKYLDTGKYSRVRLYDDAMSNIKMFISLQKEYPDVKFFPYFVTHDGTVKTIKEDGRIVKGVNTTVDVGPSEIKTQAAKFGNTVDRDGRPPSMSKKTKEKSTNVLYNLGMVKEDAQPRYTAAEWAIIEGGHTFEEPVNEPKQLGKLYTALTEGYKLQLERDDEVLVLHIKDNATGKRTEVRGKPGYETNSYDANDPLHKLLDVVGKSANISELMNGEVVTINPKHPDAERALAATDRAYNEAFDTDVEWIDDFDDGDVKVVATKVGDAYIELTYKKMTNGDVYIAFSRGGRTSVTGEGGQNKIFGAVINHIQRFVAEAKPKRVVFSAFKPSTGAFGSQDTTRSSLYRRMVQRFASQNGYAYDVEDTGNEDTFILTRQVSENSNIKYNAPNFQHEWEEALRYPEFKKLGKDAWIDLAGKGKAVTIRSAKGINNTDAADPDSFKLLDKVKQQRALDQLKSGNVEMPIVAVYPDGHKELVGGNTRLTAMLAQNGKATVWAFKVPEDILENFADGKKPGRKGLAKRSGVNTKASVSSLRKTAKNSSGEKQRMAHWLANMKAGKAKKK